MPPDDPDADCNADHGPGPAPGPERIESTDLRSLGLTTAAERVLEALLEVEQMSAAGLSRTLHLHGTQVGRAVEELAARGLAFRAVGRQAPVCLGPVDLAIDLMRRRLRDDTGRQLDALAALRVQLAGRGSRPGAGSHYLEPTGDRSGAVLAGWHRMHARRSLAAIATRTSCVLTTAQLRCNGDRCPTRLLLSRDARPPMFATEASIRRHSDELPALVVIDEVRAAVKVTVGGVSRWAWMSEPPQVRLALKAFTSLWAEGTMWP